MRIQMWGSPVLEVKEVRCFPENGNHQEFWAVDLEMKSDSGDNLLFELFYHHLPEGFVVGREIGLPGSDTFPKGD